MIVKNEEKYIEQCIKSVMSVVDEMVIVDTGSTDNTVKIVKKLGAKVFSYEWENDFSKARNFAISKATSDWIFILDADEVLHPDDVHLIRPAIQTTNGDFLKTSIHDFLGEEADMNNFLVRSGRHIFKKDVFQYVGIIHEAIMPINRLKKALLQDTSIRILHYGYLESNMSGKGKNNRNSTLIQKVLDQYPDNGLYLFYMGNEYANQHDYEKALYYYEKSCQQKALGTEYYSTLLYRTAMSNQRLRKYDESLNMICTALEYYPDFTDVEMLRGIVYKELKRYTLAIDSFNKCIEMGNPPPNLAYIPNVGTSLPRFYLTEVYFDLEDWDKMLYNYKEAITFGNIAESTANNFNFKVGKALNKMYSDKEYVSEQLQILLPDRDSSKIIDILLTEQLYTEARNYLDKVSDMTPEDIDYLKARIYFYQRDHISAYKIFEQILSDPNNVNWEKSLDYATMCCLAAQDDLEEDLGHVTSILENLPDSAHKAILLYFAKGETCTLDNNAAVTAVEILGEMLKASELALFEKSLTILELSDSNEALIYLAQIYQTCGYSDLALDTAIYFISSSNIINTHVAKILVKEFVA